MEQEYYISLNQSIEALPDAVIVVNKDIKIIAANSQMEATFGYVPPNQLIGKHLNVLIPERFRENQDKYFAMYYSDPVRRHMKSGNNLLGLRKDGSEIDIDIALAPLKVGKEDMVIAIIRDITPTKNLERSLLKKNEEFSLINTKLERLGYIIAHDLKSPLLNIHAILSFLTRELPENSTESIKGYVKDLNEISVSMMDLIAGVVEYSKISFQDDTEEDIDLNDILEEVRRLVHFPENFEFIVADNLPVIQGNKTKVLQVFLNLVNNSMKYNDKPNGKIEVYCEFRDNACLINVADNGPGIPEELRSKVFDLFRQGLIEKKGSQGIGLAVVKKIIEDHGGTITVETSKMGGADFVFSWPKFKAEAE